MCDGQQVSRNGMGMFQTRSSVITRELPNQTVNVKELKDKFTELGLSIHQPLNNHLLNSVQKKLPEGVCVNDLPAGITDEDLKYLHVKGQADEEVLSADEHSGASPCHTKADSLEGDCLEDVMIHHPTTIAGLSSNELIDGNSCGSVKELCEKFNSQPNIVEEWMEDGKVRESVLAVMQVASSVAMSCGLEGVSRGSLLDDPHRYPQPLRAQPSPQGGVGIGEVPSDSPGSLPDISDCQVSVSSLKKMFDDRADVAEEEPMEICTRL